MFLVYEKNYLSDGEVDCVEESDMKLWLSKKKALADMQSRKEMFIEDEGNDFTFMENENSEDCFVFADELQPDGETREGEFHICLVELQVNNDISNETITEKEIEIVMNALSGHPVSTSARFADKIEKILRQV